ncbi:hypothetical protein Rhopal_004043-T1 [Rhodotorula paludigena]|uniref:Mitotic checkpoint regulator, MAD2B-interacting-domain-containing protein n=1 Tax=Rhodotorula paludigena TaxID=86838 RepID=A0AAV5GQS9_9BASI|nr:hypothetical protein Rhopal_004043-T1 [Rhodotorula paludigena]
MGLVDYGSDSDSDSAPGPTPATAAPAPPSRAGGLQLPPPKSGALNLPPPKSVSTAAPAAPPRKAKDKGPVRILLDLPAPSASSEAGTDADEPAKKRPKLALGSSGSSGAPLTGLAAMLPKPKHEAKAPPPPPAAAARSAAPAGPSGLDGLFDGVDAGAAAAPASKPAPMFLPPSVAAKGKGKAAAPPPPPAEPAVDFFGIGSVTSASSSASSSASKPSRTFSAAPSVSSAPSTSADAPPAVTKKPTAADPYPGFTQLPSGEWVAKDQETYEMWMAWQQQQQQQQQEAGDVPRGFDDAAIRDQGGLVDVDEEKQRAREAWANRPSQVPGKEGDEKYKTAAEVRGIPKQLGGQAKRKHQLSSLLAAAHDNRAELEERIAQARQNRKGAGNKYGF